MGDHDTSNRPEMHEADSGRVWFSIYYPEHSGVLLRQSGYLSFREGSYEGYFGSLPNGRSIFTYRAPWGGGIMDYQGVAFWSHQPTLVELHVVQGSAGVQINGVRLEDRPEQLQVARSSNLRERNAYAPYMHRINVNIGGVKTRRFLQKVAALERAALSQDEASILSATESLRLLLIEGFVDEVNREFRIRLKFRMPAEPVLSIQGRYSDIPDLYSGPGESLELTKDRFLSHTAAIVYAKPVCVRDIIKLAANSLGVHHFGADGKDTESRDLFGFYEDFFARSNPVLIQLMSQVLLIVLDALRPLAERVALEARGLGS